MKTAKLVAVVLMLFVVAGAAERCTKNWMAGVQKAEQLDQEFDRRNTF